MAVTSADSKFSGSLQDIITHVGKEVVPNAATEAPVSPLAAPKSAEVEPTPSAETTATQPKAEVPQEKQSSEEPRFFEYQNAEGKTIKVKLGKDDTVETWVKKAKDYEHGMRKFQRERDELKTQFGEQQRLSLAKFEALQKTFKQQGIDGLINAMAGDEKAAENFRKEIAERAIKRLDASPSDIARMDYEETIMAEKRARELKEMELEELRQATAQTTQKANEKLLQSRLDLAFDKVRLDGKFEDVETEEYHNQVIWEKTLSSLEKLASSKGVAEHELSPQAIHSEFKRIAELHLKGLNLQAEKVANKTIEKKKEEALKTAQSIVSKGPASAPDVDQLAEQHMKNYNGAGFLKAMLGRLGK